MSFREDENDRIYGATKMSEHPVGGFGLLPKKSALDKQFGGEHYKKFVIQPAEFCYRNNIPYLEATAIKYLCRWRDKGGITDLEKAIHFIELLKEFQSLDKEKTITFNNPSYEAWLKEREKNVTSTL